MKAFGKKNKIQSIRGKQWLLNSTDLEKSKLDVIPRFNLLSTMRYTRNVSQKLDSSVTETIPVIQGQHTEINHV